VTRYVVLGLIAVIVMAMVRRLWHASDRPRKVDLPLWSDDPVARRELDAAGPDTVPGWLLPRERE